eukprot:6978043-Prorocentrum_lima.AAC.1
MKECLATISAASKVQGSFQRLAPENICKHKTLLQEKDAVAVYDCLLLAGVDATLDFFATLN